VLILAGSADELISSGAIQRVVPFVMTLVVALVNVRESETITVNPKSARQQWKLSETRMFAYNNNSR